ncbi:hypothetical protein UY3_15736 [Chelonia mydas]|uniref:Uncharacterized protein n=1 Tax=Chelonia mydas TaxID=8469 RepID=M7BFX3_CHEMY|nr:hypothetical protein UY3_15736 [Chelonia mydas]
MQQLGALLPEDFHPGQEMELLYCVPKSLLYVPLCLPLLHEFSHSDLQSSQYALRVLPEEVVKARTITGFKRELDKFMEVKSINGY